MVTIEFGDILVTDWSPPYSWPSSRLSIENYLKKWVTVTDFCFPFLLYFCSNLHLFPIWLYGPTDCQDGYLCHLEIWAQLGLGEEIVHLVALET